MNVLVLNQDYSPLMLCSVQRAFLLVYLKKAELISQRKNKALRSINREFPFPSIIRIDKYVSLPYKGVVMTRHNIFRRDNHECQYCGSKSDLTLDHLIPRSKGGKSTWTNLVTACGDCNARKSDFSLEEIGFNLNKRPVKPSYLMFLKNAGMQVTQEWLIYLQPNAY